MANTAFAPNNAVVKSAVDTAGFVPEVWSDEIIAASKEEGAAYKKKEDTLRMAEANKAFSHFRF